MQEEEHPPLSWFDESIGQSDNDYDNEYDTTDNE